MSRLLGAALVAAALLIGASPPAEAEPTHEVVAAGMFESWVAHDLGGHGAVLAGWKMSGLPGEAVVEGWFNTETIQLGYYNRRLGSSNWRISAQLKGELQLAALLYDYYRNGVRIPENGFHASYFEAGTSLRSDFAPHHTAELTLRGRQWFFSDRDGETGESFILPNDPLVFEPRLSYRFWNVDYTTHAADWLRPLARIEGVTFGIEGGVDLRSDTTAWGNEGDVRNAPDDLIAHGRQWLRAGWRLSPGVRLQLAEAMRIGSGDDDISRERIGGSNPYVVPVHGVQWAAFMASDHLSTQLSLHGRVGGEHELGLAVDASALRDIDRVGADEFGLALGVGAFADLRWERWFLEARFGYAPDIGWQNEPPQLSALIGFGTKLL